MILISIVVLSLVPPVSRDALIHHLNVPKLYIQHGGMYEIPSMEFSYYPMNLDLLYLIPLYFGNDTAPKFIHFSFALLSGWLIFIYLKKRTDLNYALLGLLLFLSLPIIVKLSITAYVDLGLIFFSFAALLSLLWWAESGFQIKYFVISAISCGLAIGTKYNGLITLFILVMSVPFSYSRQNSAAKNVNIKSVGYGILYLLIALTVFSPWMIRNWQWKKNPVYPLYNSLLHPAAPVSSVSEDNAENHQAKKEPVGVLAHRRIVYGENLWQAALVPIRIFFEGEDDVPKKFDGKLNPYLLLFPFFAFLGKHRENSRITREKKFLLIFSLLYFFIAFFSTVTRIRYISPIIPPLVILAVFGIKNLITYIYSFSVPCCLVFFLLVLNMSYIAGQFRHVVPFSYLSGKVSRDEYITRYRPEYPAMQFINRHLPLESRILFVFMGKRGYYCDREYLDDLGATLENLIKKSDSPEYILSGLREKGISHLLICRNIFESWISEGFETEKHSILKIFFEKYTEMLYTCQAYSVYSIK